MGDNKWRGVREFSMALRRSRHSLRGFFHFVIVRYYNFARSSEAKPFYKVASWKGRELLCVLYLKIYSWPMEGGNKNLDYDEAVEARLSLSNELIRVALVSSFRESSVSLSKVYL
jgi:hypothetical protein